jgi:hypothetical protein
MRSLIVGVDVDDGNEFAAEDVGDELDPRVAAGNSDGSGEVFADCADCDVHGFGYLVVGVALAEVVDGFGLAWCVADGGDAGQFLAVGSGSGASGMTCLWSRRTRWMSMGPQHWW